MATSCMPLLRPALLAVASLGGCVGVIGAPAEGPQPATSLAAESAHAAPAAPAAATPTTAPEVPAQNASTQDAPAESPTAAASGPAFLHADVWSTWWNDRTRCGAERAILHICEQRGGDCGLYATAVAACDPWKIVYGQVGPEKQGEPLCRRGRYPEIGGCDARKHEYTKLRFWWHGAEWGGNWPFATIKVFDAGADWTGGGELIALSSLPGAAQAAMGGVSNHGLGFGCAMRGTTQGDDKYRRPFGGFAWIEVPTERPLTVVAAAATNFADRPFEGCRRGSPSQSPWITGAPGATLGCVYAVDITFEPGRHYYWHHGLIEKLPQTAPPQALIEGFALPEVGVDITTKSSCKL